MMIFIAWSVLGCGDEGKDEAEGVTRDKKVSLDP
jgi:hypothetical protein